MATEITLAVILAVISLFGGILAFINKRYGLMALNLTPFGLMAVVVISAMFLILRQPPGESVAQNEILVNIPKGVPFKKISKILKNHNLIHSEYGFLLAARYLNVEGSIHSGKFRIRTGLNCLDLAKYLSNATPVNEKVTIIEGLTSAQIVKVITDKIPIDEEKFLSLINDSAYTKKSGYNLTSLEGLLFPDTYFFPESITEEKIITIMLSEFKKVFTDSMRDRMDNTLKMNLREIVTLASIIQGEAQMTEEMNKISSVYHNRLKRRIPLQADPTIQFIIPDGPRRLLYKDLKIKSPYNTYLHRGIPPGPINNPGKAALVAAVYPSETDYLYFVAKGDGSHVFSKTQREHLKAKRAFDKVRREVARRKNDKKN